MTSEQVYQRAERSLAVSKKKPTTHGNRVYPIRFKQLCLIDTVLHDVGVFSLLGDQRGKRVIVDTAPFEPILPTPSSCRCAVQEIFDHVAKALFDRAVKPVFAAQDQRLAAEEFCIADGIVREDCGM